MPNEATRLREQAGMNKTEWAKALGVTHPTIIRWERGDPEPKEAFLIAMRTLAADAEPSKGAA